MRRVRNSYDPQLHHIAQLVEHLSDTQKVIGSTPIMMTLKMKKEENIVLRGLIIHDCFRAMVEKLANVKIIDENKKPKKMKRKR